MSSTHQTRLVILFQSLGEVSDMAVGIPQDVEAEHEHIELLHQLHPVVARGLLHQRGRRDGRVAELQVRHPKKRRWVNYSTSFLFIKIYS